MWGMGKPTTKEPTAAARTQVVPVTSLAHDPVTHLEQYLAYYVSRLEPGYAVLVTGGWGSGKTHQVRRVLPDSHAYYVPLFGLDSIQDIEGQVFAAMFPGKAAFQKFTEKLDGITVELPLIGAIGTGGLGSALTSIFIKDAVDPSKPLILDDLERSNVDIQQLLGFINRFVEHHKCRVIVIAHDDKIVESFTETKEKVFGQTLLVKPNIEAAFKSFVDIFSRPGEPERVTELRNEILSVFRQSETVSLRVLRHVVEDYGRLVAQLEDRHLANRPAMTELVRLFSALSLEVRHGRIGRAALRRRHKHLQHYIGPGENANGPPDPMMTAIARYTSVELGSTLLDDGILVETLFEGRFIPESIRRSLDASAYFLETEAAQPWQIVGDFDSLDDDVVNDALERMERQFEGREITESGEFLHVVALKMMLANRKLSGAATVPAVKDAAIAYIDDLLAKGLLPPRTAGSEWSESFETGYQHVQYWVVNGYQEEFHEVLLHLLDARGKALEKRFPELIPPLLEVLRTDGQEFFGKICYLRDGETEFEDIPILAHIKVKDFADAWLASPKTGWNRISNALKERSKAAPRYPALTPEIDWYPKLAAEMMRRAKAADGLAKLRIERAISRTGIATTSSRMRPPPAAA